VLRNCHCVLIILVNFALVSAAVAEEIRDFRYKPDLPTYQIKSGFDFLTPESQVLQEDDFANPGFLWVDRGEMLFGEERGQQSCLSCHDGDGESRLVGAATHFPQLVAGKLINLEGQINQCRVEYQQRPPLEYESEKLLSLTAYVASLSRGMPFEASITTATQPYFDRGRAYFFQRRGQLNLACTQCHDDNWGKLLRGDKISQGHPNAYPGYRLEWQTFGSLHRRIQDCDVGIKAESFEPGSDTYIELELYLAWRAKSLVLESPGIRR
jgi:sulfur-oxidizing protein SoxA